MWFSKNSHCQSMAKFTLHIRAAHVKTSSHVKTLRERGLVLNEEAKGIEQAKNSPSKCQLTE